MTTDKEVSTTLTDDSLRLISLAYKRVNERLPEEDRDLKAVRAAYWEIRREEAIALDAMPWDADEELKPLPLWRAGEMPAYFQLLTEGQDHE